MIPVMNAVTVPLPADAATSTVTIVVPPTTASGESLGVLIV